VSKLVEGARRIFGREGGGGVADQVMALEDFVIAASGRLDEEQLEPARRTAERAQQRLRLSSEHTVVALAGATGSGKSSLFNKLTDLELAGVGVKRPTTSWALACAWGPEGASEILEWIGIPERHQVSRMSMLDASAEDTNLQGLVLLDLPDHDSTEVAHHLEVDRLVQYADLLVWILDPQKYADAAIHDRYLKPLASHGDVMLVVLNQIDRVPDREQQTTLDDVRRLLAEDGLADVPVLATSAVTGKGLDDLKRTLVKRIREKESATQRLSLDVTAAAAELAVVNGTAPASGVTTHSRVALDDTLAHAAGVPAVVDAVRRSVSQRRRQATVWPPLRLLSRFRADPLKDLHLDSAGARSSLPSATPVARSRVDTAVRELADDAARGLTQPWNASVHRAATADASDLADELDRAVVGTDLQVNEKPWWVSAVSAVQFVGLIAALIGLGWMAALLALQLSGSATPDPPRVGGLSLPLILLVGGLLLGWLLSVVSATFADRSAARAAGIADRQLRAAVSNVASEHVVTPLEAELGAYERARTALSRVHNG
jgi:GTP-binding protein EngB required for normal cell division